MVDGVPVWEGADVEEFGGGAGQVFFVVGDFVGGGEVGDVLDGIAGDGEETASGEGAGEGRFV